MIHLVVATSKIIIKQQFASRMMSIVEVAINFTEREDVLEFFSTFDNIVETLALPEGSQRFRLIPATMGHDAQKKWFNIVANNGKNQSQV
jgi:hypothetical protein